MIAVETDSRLVTTRALPRGGLLCRMTTRNFDAYWRNCQPLGTDKNQPGPGMECWDVAVYEGQWVRVLNCPNLSESMP